MASNIHQIHGYHVVEQPPTSDAYNGLYARNFVPPATATASKMTPAPTPAVETATKFVTPVAETKFVAPVTETKFAQPDTAGMYISNDGTAIAVVEETAMVFTTRQKAAWDKLMDGYRYIFFHYNSENNSNMPNKTVHLWMSDPTKEMHRVSKTALIVASGGEAMGLSHLYSRDDNSSSHAIRGVIATTLKMNEKDVQHWRDANVSIEQLQLLNAPQPDNATVVGINIVGINSGSETDKVDVNLQNSPNGGKAALFLMANPCFSSGLADRPTLYKKNQGDQELSLATVCHAQKDVEELKARRGESSTTIYFASAQFLYACNWIGPLMKAWKDMGSRTSAEMIMADDIIRWDETNTQLDIGERITALLAAFNRVRSEHYAWAVDQKKTCFIVPNSFADIVSEHMKEAMQKIEKFDQKKFNITVQPVIGQKSGNAELALLLLCKSVHQHGFYTISTYMM